MISLIMIPELSNGVNQVPDLALFNRQVSHWSNQFAPELRRVAYVIGSRMGPGHSSFTIAWSSLQRHYERAHGETVSLPTMKKYARLWADQGGLKITQGYRMTPGERPKGYADKNGGKRGGVRQHTDTLTFTVDFGRVAKSRPVYTGQRGKPVHEYWVEPWDFTQVSDGITSGDINVTPQLTREYDDECAKVAEGGINVTPHLPLNCPSFAPYSSPDSSTDSSPDSSPEDVPALPGEDEDRKDGHSLATFPGPTLPGSLGTAQRAASGDAPGDAGTLRVSYVTWETAGVARVFPASEATSPARSAVTVVLTDSRDVEYMTWLRGQYGTLAEQRAFLLMGQADRAELLDEIDAAIEATEREAERAAQHLRMIPVPDGITVYRGRVNIQKDRVPTGEVASERIAVSGFGRATGRCTGYRMHLESRDKIGYVTPAHYAILAETYQAQTLVTA